MTKNLFMQRRMIGAIAVTGLLVVATGSVSELVRARMRASCDLKSLDDLRQAAWERANMEAKRDANAVVATVSPEPVQQGFVVGDDWERAHFTFAARNARDRYIYASVSHWCQTHISWGNDVVPHI